MSQPHEYAVAVFIETPEGVPLVRDPKKPMPIFWKFPGGKSELGETSVQAALREVLEETGITLSETQLTVVVEEDRGNHMFIFFKARLPDLALLKTAGNDGEEVRVFSRAELEGAELFPPHKNLLALVL